jgi:hypothetical protein
MLIENPVMSFLVMAGLGVSILAKAGDGSTRTEAGIADGDNAIVEDLLTENKLSCSVCGSVWLKP